MMRFGSVPTPHPLPNAAAARDTRVVRGVYRRCDDLESLGYVILSMLNAAASCPLPWSGSTSVASGLATKKSTSLETLCKGFPATMLQYMKAVRALAYEDTPDYDALDATLEAMQKAGGKVATAARGGGKNSRSSARGTSSSSTAAAAAKPRASSVKRGKGTPKETPEVEVCEVINRGSANRRRGFFGPGGGVAACGGRRSTCATAIDCHFQRNAILLFWSSQLKLT